MCVVGGWWSQLVLGTVLQSLSQGLYQAVHILSGGIAAQKTNPQHLVGISQARCQPLSKAPRPD
jgi:hypothetical protein